MTDRKISGWSVQATCPVCGGVLAHLADGRPDGGRASRAIARCTSCGRQFAVEITVTDITRAVHAQPFHTRGCGCLSCCRRRAVEALPAFEGAAA